MTEHEYLERRALPMTAREVAEAVGCSERTVQNARAGAKLVGDGTLFRIAAVEGKDPIEYLTRKGRS